VTVAGWRRRRSALIKWAEFCLVRIALAFGRAHPCVLLRSTTALRLVRFYLPKISHVGVLPYRVKAGQTEYLLITSRGSGRWIIPKGRCKADAEPRRVAVAEGYEEAGLRGSLARKPIGQFLDRPAAGQVGAVLVYPFRVTGQARSWPEKGQRDLKWADAREATRSVDKRLARLIRIFQAQLARKRPRINRAAPGK
jgi:8-oxo-dGTP pyrophosphatase MutT (NUDIX family)